VSPRLSRIVPAVIATGLFGWMLWLFLGHPSITYKALFSEDHQIVVHCGSAAQFGGGSSYANELGNINSYASSFHADGDLPGVDRTATNQPYPDPFFTYRQVATDCADKRSFRVGLTGILAVPTAILGAVALRRRPGHPATIWTAPPATPTA
jgi:hypothetical protein